MPRPRNAPRIYRRPGRPGWWTDLDRDHRRVPLGTDDEAEALEKLADLTRERSRPSSVAPGDAAIPKIVKLAVERATAANTPKTAYELSLNLERIATWLEEREVRTICAVSQSHVEDYKTARRFTVGAARINRELDSWKRLHKVALSEGIGTEAALGWFAHLREPRPAPHQRAATKRELEAMLKASPAGYRDLFRLVLGSGLRDEEVRHLDADDIRPAAIVVTPKPGWTTKGYRYRTIPASRATLKAAKAWLNARPSLNLDKKRVWNVLQAACEAAKIDPISLHDLRHACASHWLAGGFKVAQISKWLGHADLLTTLRYLGIVEEEAVDPKKLPW